MSSLLFSKEFEVMQHNTYIKSGESMWQFMSNFNSQISVTKVGVIMLSYQQYTVPYQDTPELRFKMPSHLVMQLFLSRQMHLSLAQIQGC